MDANTLLESFFNDKNESNEKILSIFQEALGRIPNDKIVDVLPVIGANILDVIKDRSQQDEILPYFKLLLSASINEDKQTLIHPTFIHFLQVLSADEVTMCKNIYFNSYEFITSFDYVNNKFINRKEIKMEYPTDKLRIPSNFDFYIDHLMNVLNLINWPIYKQDPIIEDAIQTGLIQFSRLEITRTGKQFMETLF